MTYTADEVERADRAHEARVRRLARRDGLALVKSRSRTPESYTLRHLRPDRPESQLLGRSNLPLTESGSMGEPSAR